MKKTQKEIKDELLNIYLDLESSYLTRPSYTTPEVRISYMQMKFSEFLLNQIKLLEYHYRDDIHDMRYKKNWSKELLRAHKALKKYSENKDPKNVYSKLVLKEEFDKVGFVENDEFINNINA